MTLRPLFMLCGPALIAACNTGCTTADGSIGIGSVAAQTCANQGIFRDAAYRQISAARAITDANKRRLIIAAAHTTLAALDSECPAP